MIFVDTSAWFASVVPRGNAYAQVVHWINQNTQPLVTTDYVVQETLTLLQAKGEFQRALILGEQLFEGDLARIYYLTKSDILASWGVFHQFADKEWSFVDCTSKVIMEKLQITQALALDHHFHQFGSVVVLPQS